MEEVWEAPRDKGKAMPLCPHYRTATSEDPQPVLKSFSPTCCLLLESQRIFQLHRGSPWLFTKTSQQGPDKGKLKQKENITFERGPFSEPYCLQRQFRKLLWIDFSMGKRTKEMKTLRRRQARRRLISHLSVLSFSTVQKSISDEFLWKLLKQCYFIEDRCQRHQICFPGVN